MPVWRPKSLELNVKQSRFVEEYLKDFNAQQAAIRIGYSARNPAAGTRLQNHPTIAAEINRRCLEMQAKLEVNADDVRRGFARIATDPRSRADGGPTWMARITALRELGKLFGMYTHKIQVTGTLTLVELLLAADRRVNVEPLAPPAKQLAAPEEELTP